MNKESIAKIREAFPIADWPKPSSKWYRDACEYLEDVPDDEVERRIAVLRGKGKQRPVYKDFKVTISSTSGDLAKLDTVAISAIVKQWPNLRWYTHEERTMQAAWKKLNGLPAFTKHDMPRLVRDYPDIYGQQFGSSMEDSETESKADIGQMRAHLELGYETSEHKPTIEKAVLMCRQLAWLTAMPSEDHPRSFSNYGVGIVYAATEMLHNLMRLSADRIRAGCAYARERKWLTDKPLPSNLLAWQNHDLFTLRIAIRWLDYNAKKGTP